MGDFVSSMGVVVGGSMGASFGSMRAIFGGSTRVVVGSILVGFVGAGSRRAYEPRWGRQQQDSCALIGGGDNSE